MNKGSSVPIIRIMVNHGEFNKVTSWTIDGFLPSGVSIAGKCQQAIFLIPGS